MPRNIIEIMGQVPDMQDSLADKLVRAREDSTKFLQESIEKTKSKQETMLDIQDRAQAEKSQALQIRQDAVRAKPKDSGPKKGKALHKAVLKNIGQLAAQAAKDKIAEKTDPVTSKIRYAKKAGIKGMTKDALLALEPAALRGLRELYSKHRKGDDDEEYDDGDNDEMMALPPPPSSPSSGAMEKPTGTSVANAAMSLMPQESSGAKVVGFGTNKGGAMASSGDSTGVVVAKELADTSTQEVTIISQFMKKLDDQFVIQNEYNRRLLELIEDIKDDAEDDGDGGGAFGLIGDAVGVALTAGLGAWGLKLWNKIRGNPEDAAKVVGDTEKKVENDAKKKAETAKKEEIDKEKRGRRGGSDPHPNRRPVSDPIVGATATDDTYRRGASAEPMRSPTQVREDRARSLFSRTEKMMGDLDARERAFSSSIARQHSQAMQSIADTQNTATKALSKTGLDTRAELQGHADSLGSKLTDTGRMAREGLDTHTSTAQGKLTDKARILGQGIDTHVDAGQRGLTGHTQTLQQGLDTHTNTAQGKLTDRARMLGDELGKQTDDALGKITSNIQGATDNMRMQTQSMIESMDATRHSFAQQQIRMADDLAKHRYAVTSALDAAKQSGIDDIRMAAKEATDQITSIHTPAPETPRTPATNVDRQLTGRQPGRRFAPGTPGAGHGAGRSAPSIGARGAGPRGARGRPLTTPASAGTGNLAARAATTVDTAANVGESKVGRTLGAVVGNEQAKTFGTTAARIGGSAVRIAAKALSGPVGIALEVGFFLFSGRKIQVNSIPTGIKEELRDLHDNLPDNIFMKGTPQKFYTIMSKRVQDTFDTLVDYYTNLYEKHNYPKENISKWIANDKKKVDMAPTRSIYWKRITEAYVGSRGIRGLADIAKAKGSPLAAFLDEYFLATIDTRNTSEPGLVSNILNWMQNTWGSDSKDKNHKEKFLKKLKAIKPVTVFDWLAMKHVEREIMSKTGAVEYQAPVTASGETIHVGGTSTARLGKGFAINATKASTTASRSPHAGTVGTDTDSAITPMSQSPHAEATATPSTVSISPHSTAVPTGTALDGTMPNIPENIQSAASNKMMNVQHPGRHPAMQSDLTIVPGTAEMVGVDQQVESPMLHGAQAMPMSVRAGTSQAGIPMSMTEAVQSTETQMTAAAAKSRQDKATDEIADKIAAKIAPRIAVAASGASRRQRQSGGAQPDSGAIPSNISNFAMWKVLTEGTEPDYEELMEF